LIYQISNQRKFYPIGKHCLPVNWNIDEQIAIVAPKKAAKNYDDAVLITASQAAEINNRLKDIAALIYDIEKRFELDKIVCTPDSVIAMLKELDKPLQKKSDPGVNITDFIEKFISESNTTHKAGTLKAYFGLAAHMRDFEVANKIKITFEGLDIATLRNFQGFLVKDRIVIREGKKVKIAGMNNITCAKQISTLKTLVNYARTIYKIKVNADYKDFKISRKDSDFEVITLTNDEFIALFSFDLSHNKRLDQVRDVFCFSCACGLRYSDLMQLKREHINNGIKMTAAKTGQRLEIPLNPFTASILDKYKYMQQPLPVISNQKTNQYLKELCKLVGIDAPVEIIREFGVKKVIATYPKYELISIHTGRKTFTTLSLEKGIAPQDVMAITGHTTWKSFKRYVDVTNSRKKAVMAKAWGEVTKLKAM
jgi:integrase